MKRVELKRNHFNHILLPVFIILSAFLFTALLLLAIQKNPMQVYYHLFQGAFGSISALINTINKAVPICFCAFAISISQKCGTFNIGVEGQLLVGAMICTLTGIYLKGLPTPLHILTCVLAGMLGGMLWTLIPTLLLVNRGADLLVIHLLLNSVADFILEYFVLDAFASSNALVPTTESILDTAKLPYLISKPNKLSIAIIFAVACAIILHFYYKKTASGYEMQAVGLNKEAAATAGIPVKKYIFIALLTGGALAGIGGGLEILGNHHRLYTGFSPGYGYDGIPVAMLSGGNPFIIIIGSILFGALRAGSVNMRAMSGVSDEIVSVIQGLLILMVASQYFIRYLLNKGLGKKESTA